MSGKIDLETYYALVESGEVDTVVCAAPDPYGRLVGKRLTSEAFKSLCLEGSGVFVSSFVFAVDLEMNPLELPVSSAENGWVDVRLLPDLNTMRRIPWEPHSVIVICDAFHQDSDELLEVAPRTILKTQIASAAERGLTVKVASELEFFVANAPHTEAWERGYNDLEMLSSYRSDYQIGQSTRTEWFIHKLRKNLTEMGIPIESSKPEWGLGQQEITMDYSEALEMADRHVLFKFAVRELSYLNDLTATFMAKPKIDEVGSSCHIHLSLWDHESGESLGLDENGEMTEVFGRFLGGLVEHAQGIGLLFAPTINSYKRYRPDQFAGDAIAVGLDNRSCAFRLVGKGQSFRVENRIPGADVNPYYAYAGMIVAGLDGLDQKVPAPEPKEGNAWLNPDVERMSTSFHQSLARFENCSVAREGFGKDVYSHLLESARAELIAFDSETVTDWETVRYYERA